MEKVGLMLVLVGISAADSEALWIPLVIILAGALMVMKGEKSHDKGREN